MEYTYYVDVFLLNAFTKSLTYAVPHTTTYIGVGSIVRVPIQKRHEYALVQHVYTHPPLRLTHIREIDVSYSTPHDPMYASFLHALCYYYAIPQHALFKRIRHLHIRPLMQKNKSKKQYHMII